MSRQNQEDYLRAMYALCENNADKHVSSVDIAEEMGISKAAVSKMLKKMNTSKLVKMHPYSRVCLTVYGRKEAEKLTYKHRIVEVFLLEILKVDRKNMHQEAHSLEHAFSDATIKRLGKFLGNPKICPCGKNIPRIK